MQAHSLPPQFSDEVRGWLQPALDRSGTHDIEDIEAGTVEGRFQLWVGPKGAAITEILVYPKKRVLHVFLAGGDMQQIKDFQASAWAWGQTQGCTEMTLSGRIGWKRALTDWQAVDMNMRYKP